MLLYQKEKGKLLSSTIASSPESPANEGCSNWLSKDFCQIECGLKAKTDPVVSNSLVKVMVYL